MGRHFSHAMTTICKKRHAGVLLLLRVPLSRRVRRHLPACLPAVVAAATRCPSLFLLLSHRLHLVLEATLLYLALKAAPIRGAASHEHGTYPRQTRRRCRCKLISKARCNFASLGERQIHGQASRRPPTCEVGTMRSRYMRSCVCGWALYGYW